MIRAWRENTLIYTIVPLAFLLNFMDDFQDYSGYNPTCATLIGRKYTLSGLHHNHRPESMDLQAETNQKKCWIQRPIDDIWHGRGVLFPSGLPLMIPSGLKISIEYLT